MQATTLKTSHTQAWRQPRQPLQQRQHRVAPRAAAPSHRRAAGITQAAKDDAASSKQQDAAVDAASPIVRLIGTPLWWAGEAAVLLALLALVDAGYSGDWSRIGVIDHNLELKLQKLAIVAWSGHALTGAAAARVAQQQGRAIGLPFLKGFLFGVMGLFAEIHGERGNER